MNKYCLIIIVCLLILIQSCNSHFNYETEVFNKYLMDQYQETIPYDNHTYLLISGFHCSGCLQKIFTDIYGKASPKYFDSLTILTYDLTLVPNNVRKQAKILFDKDAVYENIGLSIANVTVIETINGGVKNIRVINLDDIENF